jgi:hypothetical protein
MSIKRLKLGHLLEEKSPDLKEIPNQLDKRALLVYTGKFSSLDGEVEIAHEDLERLAENHNAFLQRVKRMAGGEVPLKTSPPIQLDHSTSAKDTVGRLVGPLEVGDYVTTDGDTQKALYGNVRILGRENVEKVLDGRWTNLSIGADIKKGNLSELTITPFPAAPEAKMLSRLSDQVRAFEKHIDSAKVLPSKMEDSGVYHCAYLAKREDAEAVAELLKKDSLFKNVKVEDAGDGYTKVSAEDSTSEKRGDEKMAKSALGRLFSGLKLKHMEEEKHESVEHMKKAHMAEVEETKKKMAEEKHESVEHMEESVAKHMEGMLAKHMKHMDAYAADHKMGEEEHKEMKKKHLEAVEEEAKKHMEAMKKRMEDGSSDKDDKEKQLAEDKKEDEKKMAEEKEEVKKELSRLASDFRALNESMKHTNKEAQVTVRLARLRSMSKITPAEVKKIDIARLAKETDATVDAVFKSYENREPVIVPGALGSAKSEDISQVAKQIKMSSLEKESRMNMPLKAHQIRMAEGDAPHAAEPKHEMADESANESLKMRHMKHLEVLKKHLEEQKHDEAMKHLEMMMEEAKKDGIPQSAEHLAEPVSEEAEKKMRSLEGEMKKMSTKFEDLVKLTGKVVGIDKL